MPLSYTNNTPQGSQTVAATQSPILTNFQSIDTALNGPTGGGSGGGNFTTYSVQNTTANFAAKPVNPIGALHTVASMNGNPELAWINNVNSAGAGPYTGTQLTGGGITAAAWCQFNGTAATPTPATVNNSYNVTSVAKPSGGTFLITFTRNFTNVNYAVFITVNNALIPPGSFTRNVNTFQFNANITNPSDVSVLFFGTLV